MFNTEHQFEDEIRRIARLLWPAAEYGGAAMREGRERDGVFETDDAIHIVECTVSRQMRKAADDGGKIAKLMRLERSRHRAKVVKGWFVTLEEPTADQRGAIELEREGIVALSYDQFRARLVDARTYLQARRDYAFGSVRDPASGDTRMDLKYVPVEILTSDGDSLTVVEIAARLESGGRFVLLGDFGAGKSATLRELFLRLSRSFWDGKSSRFPIALNLRDHHGQVDPTEALERHARRIGFPYPTHLVRAWRAGFAVILLDGFDEIASAGWAGRTKRLRDLRYRSMELIRAIVKESSASDGIIVAGRQHFFDSDTELNTALGLTNSFLRVSLSEFSMEQVRDYLTTYGWRGAIPNWLPTRPLLLGYLASAGVLYETLDGAVVGGPAEGWHVLLEKVCKREADIEAGIDADTVRLLIERLATVARRSTDAQGPLSAAEIIEVFRDTCGYEPDDRGAVLLQRLPGLGASNAEDGSRVFVDKDLAASASAGDIFRFLLSPYTYELDSTAWQEAQEALGVEVVEYRAGLESLNTGHIGAALQAAAQSGQHTLALDVLQLLMRVAGDYKGPSIYINDVLVSRLVLSSEIGNLSPITLRECIIKELEFEGDVDTRVVPRFKECYVTNVVGRTSLQELPDSVFADCTFEDFESSAETTNALLGLELPLGSRVILTMLKKLYVQGGRGRRESALFRGLDQRGLEIASDVLDLLRRQGFATRGHIGDATVWHPTKGSNYRQRALKMLASPTTSKDPLILASSTLT